MHVKYRLHMYTDAADPYYVIEEQFATGWREIAYYGTRLDFRLATCAAALIDALDGHQGHFPIGLLMTTMAID